MASNYLHAVISAPTKAVADSILDSLISKKIVSGGLISEGPSRYWWEGEIVEHQYFNISAFTLASKRAELIADVEAVSPEETPIIALTDLDGNDKFLRWIEESLT